jgi:putative addiction module CopG family antidote
MEVQVTADQEAFIRRAIASGRYQNAEEALRDAMARWEEDERARLALLSALDEAEADLASGDFADYDDSGLTELAADLKSEARRLFKKS